ncbi:acyl-CoA dehydrogenase family protein [Noviherbaspirillum suwonense]|uniref:Acyl-CoA dehydrogenase n=1 Tax=Noviherbaspirillum suwonense TaxID=1224511 RepID=A0ABY1Q6G7_9BURK|nr:Acyl-CoA dehydrogenase [Noviherbaspirillum suwonense]
MPLPFISSTVPDEAAGTAAEALSVATGLALRLAESAAERDRAGGHAAQEREWIRASGLLALSIPVEFGGQGADWATVYQTVRILAQADSALAHVYAFHHLQLAGVRLYGNAEQQQRLLSHTAERRLFWGNALNPLDKRAIATRIDGAYLIDGVKSFCSGSVGSDWMTVSAWHEETQSAVIGVLPTMQEKIRVEADWDAFGQRQTDSGNVHFTQALLPDELVLQAPLQIPTTRTTLRTLVSQLIMTNLYLGIGLGAYASARRYTADESRPWQASGVSAAVEDPYIQHRYGELWLLLRPAQLLADDAAARLDHAFNSTGPLDPDARGRVAIAVAEAKCLSHRAAIEVSSQMFELMGARATSCRYGLDRFWRNARVHTLHDPVDYKLRDIGRHMLDGSYPEPTAYS